MVWDNFKRLCKERGISASSALKELGISQSMPSAWKHGTSPRADTIKRMAEYIGVTAADLLIERDEKKPPAKAEGEEPPYMVSVLKAADSVPADKREDFLRTVEAIARMYERKGQ